MGRGGVVPRDGDPRIPVRMSPQDYAVIEAAAASVNVAVGALIRECAVRYASAVAAQVARGDVRLRRARIDTAVRAVKGQVVPASSLVVRSMPESVAGMDRQRKLNEAKERARKK